MLTKPWNLYIFRHSALTEKSQILKEHVLRDHAGWSMTSRMPQVYIHYFGTESSRSLLEARGIVTTDTKRVNILKCRICPNCNEPNKPDGKFCIKCNMVLTYDAYNEIQEKEQSRESEIQSLKERYEQDMHDVREKMNQVMVMVQQNPKLANIKPEVLSNKSHSVN